MQRGPRKTTPRVKDGQVHGKHRSEGPFLHDGPLEVVTRVPGPGYRHVISEELLREFMACVPDWQEVSRGLRTVILGEGSETREGGYRYGEIELAAWSDPPARSVGPWQFAASRAVWERLGVGWRDAPVVIASPAAEWDSTRLWEPAIARALWDVFDYFDWEIEETGEFSWVCRAKKEPGKPAICDVVADVIDDVLHVYERRVLVQCDRRTAADYTLLHVFLHQLGRHVDAATSTRRGRHAESWARRCADTMWDAWRGRPATR